ncbi:AFG1-like ATPase [Tuber magnatum]|uniref:AFG1-like ATPase n=1 Tax=Tuber magnatum TaxID=42249 RepID=A0A317SJ07_9PEZI|nr:AFG1-like ATPase [Tuber magnatum]
MLATRQILRSRRLALPRPQLLRRRGTLLSPRNFHNTSSQGVRRSWRNLGQLVGKWELESIGPPMGFDGGEDRLRETLERAKGAAADYRIGPLDRYEMWVGEGRLKDDQHQRGIVQELQELHEKLKVYQLPSVVHPALESLAPLPRISLLSALLQYKPPPPVSTRVPGDLPQGLYLYGDVGSGKTMLMDMFYNTLPSNITSKTRIHFHHFMQDVHRRLHKLKLQHGPDFDAIPFVGADIAESGSVLCFDEFQCTDVADAMILRRLLDSLISHGVVMVATSNRHPDDLYKNGIQRRSFIPCITLLKTKLTIVNLDSPTDYRKMPQPASGVYHQGLGPDALTHANKWFSYLGDSEDLPHPATHSIWGREVNVPLASGKAARFKFDDLCGKPMSAADYLELCSHYEAFVVTDVPGMDHKSRDLARRFITFVDAAYESKAKLVLTTAVPLSQLFVSATEIDAAKEEGEGHDLDASMRSLMDDLGLNMGALKNSSIFSGDEERFAFARALSRLSEMGSVRWVER